MAKARGLGRGLDALLAGGEDSGARPGDQLQNVAVEALSPGRYQPRLRMDEASLADLAASIKARGVMQPILVRPADSGGYEIIAGERRWRAARLAGLAQVPALVRQVEDDAALAMALIENIQREDLNPLEEAAGLERLINEFGMTHEATAQAVGRTRSAVSNLLRLLALAPPVQQLLREDKLDMGHARALLALDAARQLEIAHVVASRGLSVRETERLVARALRGRGAVRKANADRDVLRLQEELSQKLGANVSIVPGRKGRGKLVIEYASLAHLDSLLARLR